MFFEQYGFLYHSCACTPSVLSKPGLTSVTTIMEAYVFSNYGLTTFDANWDVITLNSTDQPFDHIRNVVTITTDDEFKNYGASPPISIPQPSIPLLVVALI